MIIIIDGVEYEAKQKCLAIVEGKEVRKGDELWFYGDLQPTTIDSDHSVASKPHLWSWLPPKPETITIELTREDAQWFVLQNFAALPVARLTSAIKEKL